MICNNCGANLMEVGITMEAHVDYSYDEFEDKFIAMNINNLPLEESSRAYCGSCNKAIDNEIISESEFIL